MHQELSKTRKVTRFIEWIFIDSVVIFWSYTIAFAARALTSRIDYLHSLDFILLFVGITIVFLYINGIYRRIWSQTSGYGVISILSALFQAFLVILTIDLLVHPRPLPRSVILMAAILKSGGLTSVRYQSRLTDGLRWRWKAIWKREFPTEVFERVLIVGAGESGQMTAVRLQHHFSNTHYTIIGFIDDDPEKAGMYIENLPILGKITDIKELVRLYEIDLLVVTIHNIDGAAFRDMLESCEQSDARVKVVPDMLKFLDTKLNRSFLRDVLPEDLIGRTPISQHKAVDLTVLSHQCVLITGAAGSIGSELSRQTLDFLKPSQLILLDNNETALHNLALELIAAYPAYSIIPVLADITESSSLERLFRTYSPAIIFHAAAYKHVPMLEDYPNEAVRVNIGGTLNLARTALEYQASYFVLISTDKAVEPSSIMGASKRICELIIHAFSGQKGKTLFTGVRFGNVLGSRGSVVPTFDQQISMGGPVTVTSPEMTRYFMSSSEAVNLVIHAAAMTRGDDLFVLRMGEVVRIVDLAERMIRLRGLRPYKDVEIEFTGIRKGEKLHEELNNPHEALMNTAHPSIMMVTTWPDGLSSKIFLKWVEQLVREGIQDDNDAMNTLLSLSSNTVTDTEFEIR